MGFIFIYLRCKFIGCFSFIRLILIKYIMPTNTDPFEKWNDPMYRDDPFAPWNDPIKKDDPFAAWNDHFGHGHYRDEVNRYR